MSAIKNNDIEKIQSLLDSEGEIGNDDNYGLSFAAKIGNLEVVKLFLKNEMFNPNSENNSAIKNAIKNGHFEIVKLLLNDERVDPTVNNNWAIRHLEFKFKNEYSELFRNQYTALINLLWSHQLIKKSLKDVLPDLYNELIIDDIKNKVEKF
jgi:ankyrin repeat protein